MFPSLIRGEALTMLIVGVKLGNVGSRGTAAMLASLLYGVSGRTLNSLAEQFSC